MEVIRDETTFPRPPHGSAVTIGQYDGVHRGHRALIAEVHRLAGAENLTTVVVTFDRHPASVVRPESAPLALTDLGQKLELLAETGVDHTLLLRFDEDRREERAEDFVQEVLLECLDTRLVVVGADFHFGYRRKGNVDLLRSMGAEENFEVVGLDLLALDGGGLGTGPISSTAVRLALVEGRLDDATEMLGRYHEVRGLVVEGDGRGGELGFPTANVEVPGGMQLPDDGIYAGWYVRADGHRHAAALSLGRRPTFHDEAEDSVLEAHLLDFAGDLYGEEARVQFVSRLREEQRYESVEALVAQVELDCRRAGELLSG